MKAMGVRELKANISEALREVSEEGEIIEVTRHGQVIARLVPVGRSLAGDRDSNGAWTDLKTLATEIGAMWPQGVTAADAINDVRPNI